MRSMGSAASTGKNRRGGAVPVHVPMQANDIVAVPQRNALLNSSFVRVFTHANFLTMCPIQDMLGLFKFLSKETSELFENNEAATWYSACYSLAKTNGLYMPVERSGPVLSWKKFFHANLWPARNKWTAGYGEETSSSSFNIEVAARFRPGTKSKGRLQLPLHQFLKMRRASKSAMPALGGPVQAKEEWKDALTGVLMNDPVQLPSSGKFMDRKTALRCLLVQAQDPFDGTPLRPEVLAECPKMRSDIEAHREKTKNQPNDVRVSVGAVATMADQEGSELTAEIVEALVEAERLSRATELAEIKSERQAQHRPETHRSVNGSAGHHFNRSIATDENNGQILNREGNGEELPSVPGDRRSKSTGDSILSAGRKRNVSSGPKRHKELPRVIGVKPNRVSMYVPGAGLRPFTFSRCYDGNTGQQTLYLQTGRHVVMAALNGFNASLLTYGQTGSGKTYTIFGGEGWEQTTHNEIQAGARLTKCGIAIRAMTDIFDSMVTRQEEIRMNVSVQYVQIYNNKVFDLTSGNPVRLIKSNGALAGSSQHFVENISDFFDILKTGEQYKHYAETAMNHRSSRAHTVLIVSINQTRPGTDELLTSQLQMVDLAGSERIKKSKVVGKKRGEAIGINSSLMVLGKVIKSLVEEKSHVPYFESSLTTLLRGAFGGNSVTSAIVTCRMDDEHAAETLQALYFGERCSMITNVTRNAVASKGKALEAIDSALSSCEMGIERLKKKAGGGGTSLKIYEDLVKRRTNLMVRRRAFVEE